MALTQELPSVVTTHINKLLPDALEKSTAFLKHLVTDGKTKFSGGLDLRFPIKAIANNSSGWVSTQGALVDVNPGKQIQYGTLQMKAFTFATNFTLEDEIAAAGEDQKIDFAASKIEGSLEDAMRAINVALHGSSASAPYQPEGLLDVCASSGQYYGGLLDTDYATGVYLPVIDSTTQTVAYSTFNTQITALKARMQFNASKKMIGLMNQNVYSKFMAAVVGQQIFIDTKDMFFQGGDGFRVNGVEMYLDADVPGTAGSANNYAYIFPVDIMRLYVRFGLGVGDSKFTGKVRLPGQQIESDQNVIVANLACLNRRLVAQNTTLLA
jgi:hypothetical protein